jgi:glyceraldehyde-3-phosphate dehydrogenase/erythrose-4-phosphate dehydrogenase
MNNNQIIGINGLGRIGKLAVRRAILNSVNLIVVNSGRRIGADE